MTCSLRSFAPALAAAALCLLPLGLSAAERGKNAKPEAEAEKVDLFEAIANKQIDVKFIPKDSTQAKVTIENKTDKPLSVKLPAAFAAVPVLAQAPAAGAGRAGRTTQQQPQPMGGGFGGGGMGGGMMGGGMGGGGGMFNVAPEKIAQLKVPGVCLAHGQPEPRAAIPYEIKPLETVSEKDGVRETLAMLANGQINQRAAQVAAWHLCSNMSFDELAAKRLRFANGTSQPYFSADEMRAGMQIVATAVKAAEEAKKAGSSTNQSLSQK